jgi:hypothetical protein
MKRSEQQTSGSTAHAMERLERLQSAARKPTRPCGAELENSLGVSRGRSVETPAGDRRPSQEERCVAGARLLPREFAELEKGAQENAPQHPDACSARSVSP